MRISMAENDVLKELTNAHPLASSISKLVTATGRARNEIVEAVDGLVQLTYVSKSKKDEVYLLAVGREYQGIHTAEKAKPKNKAPSIVCRTFHNLKHEVKTSEKQLPSDAKAAERSPEEQTVDQVSKVSGLSGETRVKRIALQLKAAKDKLNKERQVVEEIQLKTDALTELSKILSDDISELLLEIKDDLERVAA